MINEVHNGSPIDEQSYILSFVIFPVIRGFICDMPSDIRIRVKNLKKKDITVSPKSKPYNNVTEINTFDNINN